MSHPILSGPFTPTTHPPEMSHLTLSGAFTQSALFYLSGFPRSNFPRCSQFFSLQNIKVFFSFFTFFKYFHSTLHFPFYFFFLSSSSNFTPPVFITSKSFQMSFPFHRHSPNYCIHFATTFFFTFYVRFAYHLFMWRRPPNMRMTCFLTSSLKTQPVSPFIKSKSNGNPPLTNLESLYPHVLLYRQ